LSHWATTQHALLKPHALRPQIPFVFSIGDDPVALGLVDSLNRPDDNVTGVTSITQSLGPKRLGLLREFVPNAGLIGILMNPNMPREIERRDIEDAARTFGWRLLVVSASGPAEFDSVFDRLVREQVSALVIITDTLFTSESKKLGALALRHAVPAIYLSITLLGGAVAWPLAALTASPAAQRTGGPQMPPRP
jgi:putative ABC transport system substrate-binding protein